MSDKKKTTKAVAEVAADISIKTDKDKFVTVSRNSFASSLAVGTEFYSDHAKKLTEEFVEGAKGQKPGFSIKDSWKLLRIAAELGINSGGRSKNEIAAQVGGFMLNEFNKLEGELLFLKRAPLKRQEIWRKLDVTPSGIDHEIAAIKKLTATDGAPNILLRCARCSLATGWASNMIAVELQDITSGTPSPTLNKIDTYEMVTGFSSEAIIYTLGGSFRGSLRPLIDNIVNGRIRGIAGIFNHDVSSRPKSNEDVKLAKELIKNDVLVLFAGDNALPLAGAGLMIYEGAKYTGEGLHSVCEATGLPPVINMGTSIDNSRILMLASAIVQEAKLGDISDLPACIATADAMNEKSFAIGQCFVSSGFYTVTSGLGPTGKAPDFLLDEMERMYGGMWDFETEPINMAQKMIVYIDRKRKALGIDKARDRILYDMAMRRELI